MMGSIGTTVITFSGIVSAREKDEKDCPPTIYHKCTHNARMTLYELADLFQASDWGDLGDDDYITEACKLVQQGAQCSANYELDCREAGVAKSTIRQVQLAAVCDEPHLPAKLRTVRLCLDFMGNLTDARKVLQPCEALAAKGMESILNMQQIGKLSSEEVEDWLCCNLPKLDFCYRTSVLAYCDDKDFQAHQYSEESPNEILLDVFESLSRIYGYSNVTASRCAEIKLLAGEEESDRTFDLAERVKSTSCDVAVNIDNCLKPYREWVRVKDQDRVYGHLALFNTEIWQTTRKGECQVLKDGAICLQDYYSRCLKADFSSPYLTSAIDKVMDLTQMCDVPEFSKRVNSFWVCVLATDLANLFMCGDEAKQLLRLGLDFVIQEGPEIARKMTPDGQPLFKHLLCCGTNVMDCYLGSAVGHCLEKFTAVKAALHDASGCNEEVLRRCSQGYFGAFGSFLEDLEKLLSQSAEEIARKHQKSRFGFNGTTVKHVEL